MKHFLHQATILSGAFILLLSCGKEEPSQPKDVKVTDITISSSSLDMVEGETQTITATISPSDATNKKVIWSSSNASIVSVDEGKITAIKEGEATITAKSDDGGKTATCKVNVVKKEIHVTDISVTPTSLSLIEGYETTLIATISPDNATNKKVIWSSSDPSIASVDEGKIRAIKEGEATITAKTDDGGKTAICKVTVSEPNYISFNTVNSGETNSLSISNLKANLMYSYDGAVWNNVENGTTMTFGNGKTLLIHGINNNSGNRPLGQFVLKENTKVECSGNIMYLLDYNSKLTEIKRDYCFYGLFKGCTSLTEAPELPATHLADSSYYAMFLGCTSLKEVPELPATKLADGCYGQMFKFCTSLTEAPDLPATQLTMSCYEFMFAGCTSLTKAPELMATQLAYKCCSCMFYGCTSLTKAPELSAIKLANGCYLQMFYECTSLTKAPELPATQLAESCYAFMFYGCTSLTKAPALPATQLAQYCYYSMFNGCTSLTNAPELPATKLKKNCYQSMFSGCTSLVQAPDLPATQLAEQCYSYMFSGCKSLATASKLPATQLTEQCYYCMFNGCTSLTTSPELPAIKLADECYAFMFYGCKSLNYTKAMFVDYSKDEAKSMLAGVSPTGTFVKNKAATWENYLVIPNGWTVELAEQ